MGADVLISWQACNGWKAFKSTGNVDFSEASSAILVAAVIDSGEQFNWNDVTLVCPHLLSLTKTCWLDPVKRLWKGALIKHIQTTTDTFQWVCIKHQITTRCIILSCARNTGDSEQLEASFAPSATLSTNSKLNQQSSWSAWHLKSIYAYAQLTLYTIR